MTRAGIRTEPAAAQGIGASPLRKEDWPLVRGEGTFIADFKRPGMVHAFVARSPFAHARIDGIDSTAVLAAPGVVDVITAADLPDLEKAFLKGLRAAAGGADAMKPGTATWTAGSAWALTVALALLRLRLQLADEPSEAVVDALDALVLLGFATAGALIA